MQELQRHIFGFESELTETYPWPVVTATIPGVG